MPGARISENGLRRIHDLQQTTESEGGEMMEWKIPQEMLEQNEEIKRLQAVISRLHAERRINAIDGQCALDEANNRVAELEVELERWEQSRDGVLSQLEEIECSKMALEADNKRLKELLESETFYLKAAQREIARLKEDVAFLNHVVDEGKILNDELLAEKAKVAR